ncbi:hypothetical protein ACLOJK_001972 [Asimina triloba]
MGGCGDFLGVFHLLVSELPRHRESRSVSSCYFSHYSLFVLGRPHKIDQIFEDSLPHSANGGGVVENLLRMLLIRAEVVHQTPSMGILEGDVQTKDIESILGYDIMFIRD